jgi:hypothetical protein
MLAISPHHLSPADGLHPGGLKFPKVRGSLQPLVYALFCGGLPNSRGSKTIDLTKRPCDVAVAVWAEINFVFLSKIIEKQQQRFLTESLQNCAKYFACQACNACMPASEREMRRRVVSCFCCADTTPDVIRGVFSCGQGQHLPFST